VREALRTQALWAALVLVFLRNTVMQGFDFHLIRICAEAGQSALVAAAMMSVLSASCCAVNVAAGLLAKRGQRAILLLNWSGCVATVAMLLAAVLMIKSRSIGAAMATALVFGLAETQYVALTVGLPFYFGKEHIGSISGLYCSMRLCGMGFGPAFVGMLVEWNDSYATSLLLLLMLPAASCVVGAFFRRAARPVGPAGGHE
jgi:cyanate permease